MEISPLLVPEQVEVIAEALRTRGNEEWGQTILAPLPREVSLHMLRFLMLHGLPDEAHEQMLAIWRAILPQPPANDSVELREALWSQSAWWDAFGPHTPHELARIDQLEGLLNQIGTNTAGLEYFYWVAEHPPYSCMDDIWDEHRRGAIIALGRYGYSQNAARCEEFLVRHLDDWINVQTDALDILVATKSRLLARVAPWYMAHDPDVRPFLQTYFGDK